MAKLHTIVLHKDEDVTSAIHAYLMDKKWKAGVIVSAVGSIYDVTVGNPGSYEMPPKMLQTTINEPCEIVSFMGEITRKCDAPAGLPCIQQVTGAGIGMTMQFLIQQGPVAIARGPKHTDNPLRPHGLAQAASCRPCSWAISSRASAMMRHISSAS